ncbi:MAG TPA: DUF5709 domain-containing protein [Marmoricola sp.]|nr:DUF5709 domain-containing protein [Marmoricola sp.]
MARDHEYEDPVTREKVHLHGIGHRWLRRTGWPPVRWVRRSMSESQMESPNEAEQDFREELPADEAIGADLDPLGDEVGDRLSGQLVAPDEGMGVDSEKDLIAEDVGYDEGGLSAEEAAMHEVDEEPGS